MFGILLTQESTYLDPCVLSCQARCDTTSMSILDKYTVMRVTIRIPRSTGTEPSAFRVPHVHGLRRGVPVWCELVRPTPRECGVGRAPDGA